MTSEHGPIESLNLPPAVAECLHAIREEVQAAYEDEIARLTAQRDAAQAALVQMSDELRKAGEEIGALKAQLWGLSR